MQLTFVKHYVTTIESALTTLQLFLSLPFYTAYKKNLAFGVLFAAILCITDQIITPEIFTKSVVVVCR